MKGKSIFSQIRFYTALLILILLVVIVLQNMQPVKVDILWWHGEMRLIMLSLFVGVCSSIITYLWMLKGRKS